MPAKIDIDALKIFTKLRTNETEYRQKIKSSRYKLTSCRFQKKEEFISTCSILKVFET